MVRDQIPTSAPPTPCTGGVALGIDSHIIAESLSVRLIIMRAGASGVLV